ncbi:MAG: ABC transporter ATP-binding protein [Planctomycetota bacterium]
MSAFWHFAQGLLRYKRWLAVAGGATLLDALCAFAGFGLLIGLMDFMFGAAVQTDATFAELVREQLAAEDTVGRIGDWSHLADALPEDKFVGFAMVLGGVLCFAFVGSGFRFTHQFVMLTLTQRVLLRARQRAFFRVLHAPMEWVWTHGTADTMSRIVQDSTRVARGLQALMGKAVREVLQGLAFLSWALIVDWMLTLLFLVGVLPIGFCIKKFGKRVRRASKYALRRYASMIGVMQESMQAAPVVRTHNAEGYERRRFHRINRELYGQEMRARTAKALASPTVDLITMSGVVVITLVASYYVFRGEAEPSHMLLVLGALAMAGASVKPLANLNNDLQESGAAATRLKETIDQPAEAHRAADWTGSALPRHAERVTFEEVSYAYPGGDGEAISGFALDVPHGQSVAIVGPNGSGKSTTLSLLPRLVEPTRGRVLIDGRDIAGHSLRSLRKQLAIVTQQSIVFEGTIAENIAYGRRHVPRRRIVEAAKLAHAHEFIERQPDGYDTVLGEGGSGLSGGQRQRLCIARAILRDPAILILDEATSQIDAESEAQIHAAMREIMQDRTTFIIAHRLSTVVDADVIVVLEAGRIVDRGTHHELLERCALYQSLVKHQMAEPVGA